jgi:hypothetical protein
LYTDVAATSTLIPTYHSTQKAYTEEDLQEAVDTVRSGALKFAEAVRKHKVPPATLCRRLKGAKPRQEANEPNQILTRQQEKALVHYIRLRGWRGEPVTMQEAVNLAAKISGKDIGMGWINRFMARNPEVNRRWTKKGESKRAQGLNAMSVESFFKELKEQMENNEIRGFDIWNADEKGVFLGGEIRFRAIVDETQKQAFATGDENRKMVTVLECIRSNGEKIPPLLIHEGAAPDGEWIKHNPCGARYAILCFLSQ